jgi:glycosyltransferase involved in cell wall biosynthesis
MKPTLLIVFHHHHLAYSPTTINLYDALENFFEVSIVTPLPPRTMRRLDNRRIEYVPIPPWASRISASVAYRLRRYLSLDIPVQRWLTALVLLFAMRGRRYTEAIGVDFLGMWVLQRLRGHGHMLSLEIEEDDPFRPHVNLRLIDSLIIQSQVRYDHLFGDKAIKCFLVQNAPVFRSTAELVPPSFEGDLLFCGTPKAGFGIYRCLDFLGRYPEFRMTIQGDISEDLRRTLEGEYPALLSGGRVILQNAYLEGRELIEAISRFAIGFCFYNFDEPEIDNFNYRSAPSGKLFTYYAAGVPVITSDIPGLASVRDFETGVMIPDLTPETIRRAVEIIRPQHARLRANCFRAAEHFSFDKAIAPFTDFLSDRNGIETTTCHGA